MKIKKCLRDKIGIENDFKHTSYRKTEGVITFWCKHCNDTVTLHTRMNSYQHYIMNENSNLILQPSFWYVPIMRCNKCHDDMIELDPNISNAIIKLNDKGYETKYCCEGYHNDIEVFPYIWFEKPIENEVYKYQLEYPWQLDDDYTIRCNMHNGDGDIAIFEIVLQKLNEWVNRLPNIKEGQTNVNENQN